MHDPRHDEADRRHDSPWHAGERALQARLGVAERMEQIGRRVIRDFMPDRHRTFYASLPFLVLGAVDEEGWPWATLLEGPPGFARSPDPRRLVVDRLPPVGDPTREGVAEGAAIGLLGIELPTRRRNRLNGRVRALHATGFTIEVQQAFGNCPQYIHRREAQSAPGSGERASPRAEPLARLDAEAKASIARADTAFVASFVDGLGDGAERSVDVSHRGGRPGFVRVDGDRLTIPEFAGNLHFNTLGNLLVHPHAGLVFVDFEAGDLLHLSGRTTLLLDGPESAGFAGAERMWTLDVERAVRRRATLDLRMRALDASPQSLATGTWAEADDRRLRPHGRAR